MQNPVATLIGETVRATNAEADAYRASAAGSAFDRKVVGICTMTSVCLALAFYTMDVRQFYDTLVALGGRAAGDKFLALLSFDPQSNLPSLLWFVGCTVLFYLFIPALFVRFVLNEPLKNFGLSFRGATKDAKLYGALAALVLPLIFAASFLPSFKAYYPFFARRDGGALLPGLLIWELAYMLQFVAVEFLFRGVLVHGLKHRFGFYAVIVMCMPYCMLHFGKPLPETLGAIVAGVVLGTLSLRNHSIAPGVLIHSGVALSMDLAALWQKS